LTSYIDERAIEGVIWKDDLFVSRTFNGVVHQLLSLQRDTEALEAGMTSPRIVMREAMRRACIILFALLRDKFSVHPSGMSQHSNSVKELLSQHPVDWSGFSDLHLWVLVTTSFAIEDDKISGNMDEIRGAAVQLGISGWNDVVEVMKSVLWMGKTFRTRNDLLKDFFELSTVINEV
jgi:hypothetical protein